MSKKQHRTRAHRAAIAFIAACYAIAVCAVISADDGVHRPREPQVSIPHCESIGGIAEYRLADGSRVDCLTDEFAIEHDWMDKSLKWAECLGQAAYYAAATSRKAKCILIHWGESGDKNAKNWKKAVRADSVVVECITVRGQNIDCATGAPNGNN